MTISMIAAKRLTYRTRRLKAGDPFEASEGDARLFRAVRLADYAADYAPADPSPGLPAAENSGAAANERAIEEAVEAISSFEPPSTDADPPADLRADYEALTGGPPDRRWGEARLRAEIARRRNVGAPAESELSLQACDPHGPGSPGDPQ